MTISLCLNWDGVVVPVWVDYTDSISLEAFKRNLSLDGSDDQQKSITAEIEVSGAAYIVIKSNLIDSVNRYSNFYVVRIIEELCNDNEFLFKIEDKQLRWCDNGTCKMQLTLVEYTPLMDCIKRTTLADNTYGDFQLYPASGYPHPRFRYCDVVKPRFLYGMLVTISNALVAFIFAVNAALISIFGIIVWVVNFLGGSWTIPQLGYGFAEDLLGCNLGHPAPLVRTYIDNVCNICGVSANDVSAPTLYEAIDNPYYYMCLATAYTTKGVDMDGAKDYIKSNEPSWDLGQFLSILKKPFNSRWFLWQGIIYFNRKDLIGVTIWGLTPAIDLSGVDADYLLGDVCYTYNGEGKAKKLLYNYGIDPTDNIGNELLIRFRGIHEDLTMNANYNETIELNCLELGAVSCILDGKDSGYDEIVANALAGPLIGTSYDGCIKTQGDTFSLAKLLIWDIATPINDARCLGNAYNYYGPAGQDIGAFQDDDNANYILVTDYDCKNYNFPMSFDPDADNILGANARNLWQFHSIDVPDPAKKTNIDIDLTLDYCCRYNNLNIYQTIILQDGITQAEIKSVDFDHGKKREIKITAKLK